MYISISLITKSKKKVIMKTITTTMLVLLMTTISFGQNAEKILVKAFNLQGNNAVVLNLDGNSEVETWNENYVRVQMTIGIENGSEGMLKSLIKVGRYNLTGTETTDGFEINMPNIVKKVTVGGQELIESFSYIVYTPQKVTVENLNETSAAVEFE
ncbi:MAG: hypothetical protein ACI85O_003434 [Saprospiraceae bacterium]|jgi:hypothetical protein